MRDFEGIRNMKNHASTAACGLVLIRYEEEETNEWTCNSSL